MRAETNVRAGGAGFLALLQIAFIVLKLCGIIDWNWIWVLAPYWISFAIMGFILVAIAIYCKVKDVRKRK